MRQTAASGNRHDGRRITLGSCGQRHYQIHPYTGSLGICKSCSKTPGYEVSMIRQDAQCHNVSHRCRQVRPPKVAHQQLFSFLRTTIGRAKQHEQRGELVHQLAPMSPRRARGLQLFGGLRLSRVVSWAKGITLCRRQTVGLFGAKFKTYGKRSAGVEKLLHVKRGHSAGPACVCSTTVHPFTDQAAMERCLSQLTKLTPIWGSL